MPRGVTAFDHAALQQRLWTPAALSASGLLTWFEMAPQDATFGTGGVLTVQDRVIGHTLTNGNDTTKPFFTRAGTQVTTGLAPTLLRWNPPARLYSETELPDFAAPCLIVFALRPMEVANWGLLFRLFSSTNHTQTGRNSGNNVLYFTQNNTQRAWPSYIFDGRALISAWLIRTNTTLLWHLNGVAVADTSISYNTFINHRVAIGCSDAAAPSWIEQLGGFHAGFCIVTGDAASSPLVRQRLEGHYAWRLGQPDVLPATHPFRNAPPLMSA